MKKRLPPAEPSVDLLERIEEYGKAIVSLKKQLDEKNDINRMLEQSLAQMELRQKAKQDAKDQAEKDMEEKIKAKIEENNVKIEQAEKAEKKKRREERISALSLGSSPNLQIKKAIHVPSSRGRLSLRKKLKPKRISLSQKPVGK